MGRGNADEKIFPVPRDSRPLSLEDEDTWEEARLPGGDEDRVTLDFLPEGSKISPGHKALLRGIPESFFLLPDPFYPPGYDFTHLFDDRLVENLRRDPLARVKTRDEESVAADLLTWLERDGDKGAGTLYDCRGIILVNSRPVAFAIFNDDAFDIYARHGEEIFKQASISVFDNEASLLPGYDPVSSHFDPQESLLSDIKNLDFEFD